MPQVTDAQHRQLLLGAIEIWRSLGYAQSSIDTFSLWIQRFRVECGRGSVDYRRRLDRSSVTRFVTRFVRARDRAEIAIRTGRSALRVWAATLGKLGERVPEWFRSRRRERHGKVIAEYRRFRRETCGIRTRTIDHECWAVRGLLAALPPGRSMRDLSVSDVDSFVLSYGKRVKPVTLRSVCYVVRAFLRFLHVTGRHKADLTGAIVSPSRRRDDAPPRALPWRDVQKILAAIDRSSVVGKRDHAAFLLMASYGMGVGETLALRLDDISWRDGTLRMVRPKTGVETMLPLVPPVARALSEYVQVRPRRPAERRVFLGIRAPHSPATGEGLQCRLRHYAAAAGISAEFLGTHLFRHSHAARQIENAVDPKVVSDILGQRDPRSISSYARVATERLRAVCLPVPR
jgi:integrase/recombinase XerD